MRVLTFLHSFEAGGVERVALRLVRHWREIGIDAQLFVGRSDGALRDEVARDLRYDLPFRVPRRAAWFETWWMIVCLPRQIRRTRPDVLFCAGSTYTVVAVAMKLLLRGDCPPVVAKISNDIARRDLPRGMRGLWFAWLRLQAHFIDHWVVMQKGIEDEARQVLGAKSITVVPDPAISLAQIASPSPAPRYRESREGRRFVAVGRLVAQKDYPLMLRAFARSAKGGDTLTIFGDGAQAAQLGRLARSLAIEDNVRFAGHVPDAAARLSDYDVLLMSSGYEGVPAAIVEALAVAMPIIVTDCGRGVRELLANGRLGTIVNRDVGSFASAISAASLARPSARPLINQARTFTIESSAARYVDVFRATAFRGTACPHDLSLANA
jgi:glycosyltransferase involved in cell wall biosynthesis